MIDPCGTSPIEVISSSCTLWGWSSRKERSYTKVRPPIPKPGKSSQEDIMVDGTRAAERSRRSNKDILHPSVFLRRSPSGHMALSMFYLSEMQAVNFCRPLGSGALLHHPHCHLMLNLGAKSSVFIEWLTQAIGELFHVFYYLKFRNLSFVRLSLFQYQAVRKCTEFSIICKCGILK